MADGGFDVGPDGPKGVGMGCGDQVPWVQRSSGERRHVERALLAGRKVRTGRENPFVAMVLTPMVHAPICTASDRCISCIPSGHSSKSKHLATWQRQTI